MKIVDGLQIYAIIGFVFWMAFEDDAIRQHIASGKPCTTVGASVASLIIVLGWPIFIILAIAGARR